MSKTDLLFDWFGFVKTIEFVVNSTEAKQLNPKKNNQEISRTVILPLNLVIVPWNNTQICFAFGKLDARAVTSENHGLKFGLGRWQQILNIFIHQGGKLFGTRR